MKVIGEWQMSGSEDDNGQSDLGRTALIEPTKPDLQQPKRYQVVMINDDYTPMEFVIEVLELFFGLTGEHATRLMLQVHHLGKAGIGSYSRDVAETKAAMVVDYARQHEHPLLCLVEPMP